MSKPNFFIENDATLNFLMDLKYQDEYPDIEFRVDLIQVPFAFEYTFNENSRSIKIMDRAELASVALKERGIATCKKGSDEIEIFAPKDLAQNLCSTYIAFRNLNCFIHEKGLDRLVQKLDPDEAGLIFTVEDNKLAYDLVSGAERPEMVCFSMDGKIITCRPYFEDFAERVAYGMVDVDNHDEATSIKN